MNEVKISGRLGADIIVRETISGMLIGSVNIAHQTKKGDDPLWIKLVIFGPEATDYSDLYKKGELVLVHGRLSMNKWTNNQGIKQETMQIVVSHMESMFKKINQLTSSDSWEAQQKSKIEQVAKSDDWETMDDIPF